MATERKEFEAWADNAGHSLAEAGFGYAIEDTYSSLQTESAWRAWQASRAAMVAEVEKLKQATQLALVSFEIIEEKKLLPEVVSKSLEKVQKVLKDALPSYVPFDEMTKIANE